MNHEHITIEKDEILTISKIHIDNFEKKVKYQNGNLISTEYIPKIQPLMNYMKMK